MTQKKITSGVILTNSRFRDFQKFISLVGAKSGFPWWKQNPGYLSIRSPEINFKNYIFESVAFT